MTEELSKQVLPVNITSEQKDQLVDNEEKVTGESFPLLFYVTTAISYTNGPPHIEHAYEVILADSLVRWNRLMGRPVFFATGTEEHGQKIAKTAQDNKISPKELCDLYVELFKKLNHQLNISFDTFVRTTDELHKNTAQKIWKECFDNGDIYLGVYDGWYNVREERYINETEAKEFDYKDPISGSPLTRVKEPSYFFRMEKYRSKLIMFLKSHPHFIQDPKGNEILKCLDEPLLDLCISRIFDWGIPIPETEHVMYVWFEALTNYLSAIDYFRDKKWWKGETVHIIGKDILWFHAVVWPCMLWSAGIDLPKRILVHGFVNDPGNTKMSKSLNNVIDPFALLQKFTCDQIRYYFLRECSSGLDLKFSMEGIKIRTKELACLYGNLVNRTFSLLKRFCDSKIPPPCDFLIDKKCLLDEMDSMMLQGDFKKTIDMVMEILHATNQWLYQEAPWKLPKTQKQKICVIIRELLEKLLFVTCLLAPFIPSSTELVFSRINIKTILNFNLVEGTPICCDTLILFATEKRWQKKAKGKK